MTKREKFSFLINIWFCDNTPIQNVLNINFYIFDSNQFSGLKESWVEKDTKMSLRSVNFNGAIN